MSSALHVHPLAQKRGGAKHIREVVQCHAHAQPKTVWFTRLEALYQVYSLAEPHLLALIWPEAKARVASSPRPFSERVELDEGPRLCIGCVRDATLRACNSEYRSGPQHEVV